MCRALRNNELDVAVALTEGVISDIAASGQEIQIVATYIDTPLHWGVNVSENSSIRTVDDLKGKTFGISRLGSGSHLMAYVLAEQKKWNPVKDVKLEVKGGIGDLITGLEDGSTDVFLWETLTVKPHMEKHHIRNSGEVVTPWPCFVIAVRKELLHSPQERATMRKFLDCIQEACVLFKKDKNTLEFISQQCHLSLEDSKKWFDQVAFSQKGAVSTKVLQETVATLKKTGIVAHDIDITTLYDKELTLIVP